MALMAKKFIHKLKRAALIAQAGLYDFGLKEIAFIGLCIIAFGALYVFAIPFSQNCEQDFLGAETQLNAVTAEEFRIGEGDYVAKCRLANKHLDLLHKLRTMRAACGFSDSRRNNGRHTEEYYVGLISLQDIAAHEACR